MKRLFTFAATVLCISLTACQTHTWSIEGEGANIKDGDTLYLTSDIRTGYPMDTTVVKNGKFEFTGDEDTLMFGMVYSRDKSVVCLMFIEKGEVHVSLAADYDSCRISGTPANDKYQTLTDQLLEAGNNEDKYRKVITAHVRENINSEYGYFLFTFYDDYFIFSAQERKELMSQLPQEMQERPVIKQLAERIERELKVAEGQIIENFSMNDINGKPVSIYDEIKGKKVVILDFWASWCSPCRAEMPRLIALYKQYASKGLGIVGISLDNDADKWKAETQRQGITWTQMSDLQGWDNAVAQMFAVRSIPYTVIIDAEGKILKKNLRGEALEKYIADYLNNK